MEKKKIKTNEDFSNMSDVYKDYLEELVNSFHSSTGATISKLENFSKYVPRSSISRFLCKYEIFKKILNIQGSIIEGGVFFGGGLMTWAQLSSILEPANHQRRIIGFDTFAGFTTVTGFDKSSKSSHLNEAGYYFADSYEELQNSIKIYDMTRYMNHIKKIELVKGNVVETIPKYIKDNPHLIVSLLYLDFDIFEPTAAAIKNFLPLMPKGSIIAFDEFAQELWPGETQAVLQEFPELNKWKIERFPFGTSISYTIID